MGERRYAVTDRQTDSMGERTQGGRWHAHLISAVAGDFVYGHNQQFQNINISLPALQAYVG